MNQIIRRAAIAICFLGVLSGCASNSTETSSATGQATKETVKMKEFGSTISITTTPSDIQNKYKLTYKVNDAVSSDAGKQARLDKSNFENALRDVLNNLDLIDDNSENELIVTVDSLRVRNGFMAFGFGIMAGGDSFNTTTMIKNAENVVGEFSTRTTVLSQYGNREARLANNNAAAIANFIKQN